jgi:hypothetical protein
LGYHPSIKIIYLHESYCCNPFLGSRTQKNKNNIVGRNKKYIYISVKIGCRSALKLVEEAKKYKD